MKYIFQEIIIDCIRFFTSNNIANNRMNTTMELNTIPDKTTMKSSIPYSITPLPIHIKIILSKIDLASFLCHKNSQKVAIGTM